MSYARLSESQYQCEKQLINTQKEVGFRWVGLETGK